MMNHCPCSLSPVNTPYYTAVNPAYAPAEWPAYHRSFPLTATMYPNPGMRSDLLGGPPAMQFPWGLTSDTAPRYMQLLNGMEGKWLVSHVSEPIPRAYQIPGPGMNVRMIDGAPCHYGCT